LVNNAPGIQISLEHIYQLTQHRIIKQNPCIPIKGIRYFYNIYLEEKVNDLFD